MAFDGLSAPALNTDGQGSKCLIRPLDAGRVYPRDPGACGPSAGSVALNGLVPCVTVLSGHHRPGTFGQGSRFTIDAEPAIRRMCKRIKHFLGALIQRL